MLLWIAAAAGAVVYAVGFLLVFNILNDEPGKPVLFSALWPLVALLGAVLFVIEIVGGMIEAAFWLRKIR